MCQWLKVLYCRIVKGHRYFAKRYIKAVGNDFKVVYYKQCRYCKNKKLTSLLQYYQLTTEPKYNIMAILSITAQPATDSIHAAYRPIIIRCTAEQEAPVSGRFVPPVVYCDVYFNGVYYKTLATTQPINKPVYSVTPAEYSFDIQGLCQEVHEKILAQNGISSTEPANGIALNVYCKLRSSTVNVSGFTIPQLPLPVQGTGNNPPAAGGGTQTQTFVSINAILKHSDNQDLATHLNSFKKRIWQSTAYPLTHRPDDYRVCKDSADVFPILNLGTKELQCIRLNYKLKGSPEFVSTTFCPAIACVPVGYTLSIPNAVKDVPYTGTITLTGTAPFAIGSQTIPAWTTANLVGNTITITGTPLVGDVGTAIPIGFVITNDCGTITVAETIDVFADAPVCDPVGYTTALPDGQVGETYTHTSSVTGTAPFVLSAIVKPSWLTITKTGSTIDYSGTPDVGGTGITVSFTLTNCEGGSNVNFSDIIDVLAVESYLDTTQYSDGGGAISGICDINKSSIRSPAATAAATADTVTIRATFHVIADNGCEADFDAIFNPTDSEVFVRITLTCGMGACSAVVSSDCIATEII